VIDEEEGTEIRQGYKSFREKAKPYNYLIRAFLMLILLMNVGYNIIVFKDNIVVTQTYVSTFSEPISDYNDIEFNIEKPFQTLYGDDPFVDEEFERDKAILNIIFSLWVFTMLRYGKPNLD